MAEVPDTSSPEYYGSIDSFLALLKAMGYLFVYVATKSVTVRVPIDQNPQRVRDLEAIAKTALSHSLFESYTPVTDKSGVPSKIVLSFSKAVKPLPLYQQVEILEDYFILADRIPRVVLKFDFDSPKDINLTSRFMNCNSIYIGYEGEVGDFNALEDFLKKGFPDDLVVLERAYDTDDTKTINRLWLDLFDYEFAGAIDIPHENVIVHCIGPIDKGYMGDYMFFLMNRDDFEELRASPSYTVIPGQFADR